MKPPLRTVLGRNLSDFRTVEGQSRFQFAERLGVNCDYLEELEKGLVDPGLGTVDVLAARIGMEPVLLLEEVREAA